MTIEAMKQALEALEKHAELGLLAGATITAIREALAQPEHSCVACEGNPKGNNNPCAVCGLAQPEQEPVACVGTNGELMWLNKSKVIYSKPIPLYTTPPTAPVQEPPPGTISTTITTTPQPKREWVGLTDEEIDELEDDRSLETTHDFICAIEAKLKEKNT